MKILTAEIEEFGILRERRFDFGDGLNLIEGANESGKSTLIGFIRFALYGFDRRNGEDRAEIEKRLSVGSGRASGRLILEYGGERYGIFRSISLSGTGTPRLSETCKVQALDRGETPDLGKKTPGEYFLGLPRPLFDSTLCVGQSELERVCDRDMGDRVGALFEGAEGDPAAKSARALLEKARRELLHANGRGGRIFALQQRVTEIDTALAATQDARETGVKLSQKIGALEAEYARVKAELRVLDGAARKRQLEAQLQSFEDLRRARRQAEAARAEQERLAANACGEEDLRRAAQLLAQKRTWEERLRQEKAETERAAEQKAAVAEKTARLRRQRNLGWLLAAVFLALCGMGAGLRALVAYPAALLVLPLLLSFGAAGFALVRQRALGQAPRGSAPDVQAPAGQTALATENEALQRELTQLFLTFGMDYTSVEAGEDALRTLSHRQGERLAAIRAQQAYCTRAEEELARFSARVNGLNEGQIRGELERLAEIPVHADAARAGTLWETLNAEAEELERKIAAANKERITLTANTGDPEELERQKREALTEVQKARRQHAALLLAGEALQAAEEALRKDLTPRLQPRARAIFCALTGKEDQEFYVNDRFSVTLDLRGEWRPLSHFSAGCQDAAHLSLRLALSEMMSGEPLPLLLDEALARIDDGRAAAFLGFLQKACNEGRQCLLFTCHSREARLCACADVTKIVL